MRQVCVIGLGQFGTHLARTLVKYGCEVLAVDINEARVDAVRDDVHRAIIGDVRNFAMLDSVISSTIDEAVISLGDANIEPSILATLHLRKIGVQHVLSTAANDDHAQILRAVGATEIIFPERETAERTARRVANPGLRDMFSLAEDHRIMELDAPPRMHGRSLAEADLRKKFDLLVLAVRGKDEDRFHFLPSPTRIIKSDEILMVLGRELDLAQFSTWS